MAGTIRAAAPVSPSALIAFSAAAVGAGLGRALMTTYLPVLLERIRDAPGLIGTVMLVNTLAGFFVPLIVGVWSDRLRDRGHGRTVPFVLGGTLLAAGGLAAVALGHASSYWTLALFAAVTYAGLNAVTTGHRAMIPENFGSDQRAAATGGEELALLLGTLLGVATGGALIELEGWAPFALGAVLLPIFAWPTVHRMRSRELPLRRPPQRARPGLRYYVRAAGRPGGRLILLAQGLWVLGYVGLPPFFILYAERELELRPRTAGLLLAAFGLLTALAMLLAGLTKTTSQRGLLVAGAAAMGTGLVAVATTSQVAVVAVALVPVAAGFGVLTTVGFPAYSAFIPEGEEGAYSALYFAVRSVASAIALPAAGWTIALSGSYRALFVFGGCVALAAVVPLLALRSERSLGEEARAIREAVARSPVWQRPGARALACGLIAALLTAFVMAAGIIVDRSEALFEADKELLRLLYDLGSSPPALDWLVVDAHIQNYALLTLLAAVAARHWRPGRAIRSALTVAAAGIAAFITVRLCWVIWDRPRPEETLGLAPANEHSFDHHSTFPSGHVAVTTALVAAISALFPALRIPLWGYVGLIAVTRVSFGAHYPSDVILSLLLGYAFGSLTVALVERSPVLPRLGLRSLLLADSGAPRVRRLARGLSLAATGAFAILLVGEGPPASPEGGVPIAASLEHELQIGLFVVGVLGTAGGWYRNPLGGVLLIVGFGLGTLAALQYTPLVALFAYLAFTVPGVLFLLAWRPLRRPRGLALLAIAIAGFMSAGGFAAAAVYDAAFGPAHPQSERTAPQTWRVQWIWAGGVTSDSAIVTARLNEDSSARLLIGRSRDLEDARRTASRRADDEANERLLSFAVSDLEPATRYFYGLEVDGRLDPYRIGRFRTFGSGRQSFKLAFAGCARVDSNGVVFEAIRRENPLLYLILGDMFYANIEENGVGLFLEQYDRALLAPAQGALYRSTPIAYTWDDHDFGGDGSDASAPSRPAARWAYRNAVPHYPLPTGSDGPIYQAFTIGRVRFLVLDTRSARVPGRAATMLGQEQLDWLKAELLSSRERYPMTVIVNSVPWIDEADPAADSWGGFAAERAELSRFIARERIPGILMLSADAHMLAIDDGSHSDYSGSGRAGFPLMHAAALDRPGGVKGGPYSEGTFPGAGHYGTMTVKDRGNRLDVRLVGRDYQGNEVARLSYAIPAG
jgi:membrane-associated phospholipid phosphatase